MTSGGGLRWRAWRGERGRARARLLLASLASGVLIALSLPPFGFWPLAWFGYAGVVLVLRGRGWRSRLAAGGAAGLGQYAIGLFWVSEFVWYGYVLLTILSALFVAAGATVIPGRRLRHLAAGLPAAMVLADWARERYPLGGLPLAGTALGQSESPLVPIVRWGGSLALTGATVLCGVAIAAVVLGVREGWAARRAAPLRRTVAATLAVLAVVAAVVAGRLGPDGGSAYRSIRVALVQGGGRRGTRAVYTNPNLVFSRTLAAARVLRRPLDLVVWPEGVLQTDFPYRLTIGSHELAALARRLDSTIVAGVEQNIGKTRYTNEAVAWAPTGKIVGSYEKNHLVPFGEYIPYRSVLKRFFNLHLVPYNAIAGHGPGILRTPAGPLGMMISFEVFFDVRARGAVRAGGQLLVVPTDTASYSNTQVPTQEIAAAQLRSWETGRSLVMVAPTGYCAVVGPEGQVYERSRLDERTVVEATVGLRRGQTLYVRFGDDPELFAGLAVVIALCGLRLRRGPRPGSRRRAARGMAGGPDPSGDQPAALIS